MPKKTLTKRKSKDDSDGYSPKKSLVKKVKRKVVKKKASRKSPEKTKRVINSKVWESAKNPKWLKLYYLEYTDEQDIGSGITYEKSNGERVPLTRNIWGRRKFSIINNLTGKELYSDFGYMLPRESMSKADILKFLKQNSWRF